MNCVIDNNYYSPRDNKSLSGEDLFTFDTKDYIPSAEGA